MTYEVVVMLCAGGAAHVDYTNRKRGDGYVRY
jgi:hypothetical protein